MTVISLLKQQKKSAFYHINKYIGQILAGAEEVKNILAKGEIPEFSLLKIIISD